MNILKRVREATRYLQKFTNDFADKVNYFTLENEKNDDKTNKKINWIFSKTACPRRRWLRIRVECGNELYLILKP